MKVRENNRPERDSNSLPLTLYIKCIYICMYVCMSAGYFALQLHDVECSETARCKVAKWQYSSGLR